MRVNARKPACCSVTTSVRPTPPRMRSKGTCEIMNCTVMIRVVATNDFPAPLPPFLSMICDLSALCASCPSC